MEDIYDRELERYIQGDNAAKWFCNFVLTARTRDHSVFSRIRKRIGTNKWSQIFNLLKDQMKEQGFFVYSSLTSLFDFSYASLDEFLNPPLLSYENNIYKFSSVFQPFSEISVKKNI